MGTMLDNELKKNIQLEIEKEHLEQVVAKLNEDLLLKVEGRKKISSLILKNREDALEEYKDDEDKILEYFDHERYVKEEAFTSIDRRIKEILVLLASPYFGRIDFREALDEMYSVYVGRFGFFPDYAEEPIVIDWRSKVASLFYNNKLGEAFYDSPDGKVFVNLLLKRQYIIKKQKLEGMFDSSLDIKDEILQMVLSKNAEDKLKDIVMTIQSEQDEIIRADKKGAIIVNGVAGSGKTTIALHRVAYLLYNFRESLNNKVLILGSNSIFLDYISNVLPSLGEDGVNQKTFASFSMELIGLNNIMSYKDYMEKLISKDEEFVQDVRRKRSKEYIKELDKLINVIEGNYYNNVSLNFYDKIFITKEEIDKFFNVYYKDMPLFKRGKKIKSIIYSKIKDERDKYIRIIDKNYKENLKNIKDDTEKNNIDFIRRMKITEIIEEVMRIKKQLDYLDNYDTLRIYNEFNNEKELYLDDLAPIMYLKIKLEGIRISSEIKHVVIDEAQDYSFLQFHVIKLLTKSLGYTIVGDESQNIILKDESTAMLDLKDEFNECREFNLYKSYRSTAEIMEYSNKFFENKKVVPLVRKGDKVLEYKISNDEDIIKKINETLDSFLNSEYESVGVICPSLKEAEKLGKELKKKRKINLINSEDAFYEKGETIIPIYFSKGLEFDAVIIVLDNKMDENLKYVMATRALHKLVVIEKNQKK
ncbi:MAG: UvrD-helicase domain-containing protein [Clostridiaceae bacterium]